MEHAAKPLPVELRRTCAGSRKKNKVKDERRNEKHQHGGEKKTESIPFLSQVETVVVVVVDVSWLDWASAMGEAALDKRFDTPDHATHADSTLGASRSQSQRRQPNLIANHAASAAETGGSCTPHLLLRHEQGYKGGRGARMCEFVSETLTRALLSRLIMPRIFDDATQHLRWFLKSPTRYYGLEIARTWLYFSMFGQLPGDIPFCAALTSTVTRAFAMTAAHLLL